MDTNGKTQSTIELICTICAARLALINTVTWNCHENDGAEWMDFLANQKKPDEEDDLKIRSIGGSQFD